MNPSKPGQTRGFSLMELVLVIVVLGVLAAVAVPRYLSLRDEARVATVQTFAAQLAAAAHLIQAKWATSGGSGSSHVRTADGANVSTDPVTGFPTVDAAGIGMAMNCESSSRCQGMQVTYAPFGVLFTPPGAMVGFCTASYLATTPLDGQGYSDTTQCSR